MEDIMDTALKSLTQYLGEHLSLSFSRLDCLSGIIFGLLQCESVRLSDLSARMCGDANISSKYRRLQRFFPELQI